MTLRKETCLAVLAVILCVSASAQQALAQTTYDAPNANITIDGDASDWAGIGASTLNLGFAANSGGDPLIVDIRWAWDATNLYTLVEEVSDDDAWGGANAVEWLPSEPNPPAPWNTDSVGFYDVGSKGGPGSTATGPRTQWWIGLSDSTAADQIRHMSRPLPEVGGDLIVGQAANRDTSGGATRAVEFRMPWADIRHPAASADAIAGHTLEDVGAGYQFENNPLLVDGVGAGAGHSGQTFPGGQAGPGNIAAADFSIVNLVPEPSSILIFALGILGLAGFGRRR